MDAAQPLRRIGVLDIFLAFLGQGLTAFGGPAAHIAYFRRAFVERRGWLRTVGSSLENEPGDLSIAEGGRMGICVSRWPDDGPDGLRL